MREFLDTNGVNLIIKFNKTNIILETDEKNIDRGYFVRIKFSKDVLNDMKNYLETIANQIWDDFTPKEASSLSSDYEEYYDRKYDNNAYLKLSKDGSLRIEKPDKDSLYMYKFNKKRMESFIYDLKEFM